MRWLLLPLLLLFPSSCEAQDAEQATDVEDTPLEDFDSVIVEPQASMQVDTGSTAVEQLGAIEDRVIDFAEREEETKATAQQILDRLREAYPEEAAAIDAKKGEPIEVEAAAEEEPVEAATEEEPELEELEENVTPALTAPQVDP